MNPISRHDRILTIAARALFGLIFVTDLATWRFRPLGYLGVALFLLAHFFLVHLAARALADMFRRVRQGETPLTLISLLTTSICVLSGVFDAKSVGFEATQSVACVLDIQWRTPDAGFLGHCLFGFPARGFYFQALPSWLLGRTPFALNLVPPLMVVVGLTLFAAGLPTASKATGRPKTIDWTVALLIPAVLHVYSFNSFLFSYDHASVPSGMAFAFWGLLLRSRGGSNALDVASAFLVLLLSLSSYTPGLLIVVIGTPPLVYLAWRRASTSRAKAAVLGAVALLAIHGLMTLKFRGDLHAGAAALRSGELVARNLALFKELFYVNGHSRVHTMPMAILTGLALVAGILGFVGLKGGAMALCVLAIFSAAVSSTGIVLHGVEYDFQRGRTAYPILLTLAFLAMDRLFRWLNPRWSLVILAAALSMVYLGASQSQRQRTAMPRDYRVEWASGWLRARTADGTFRKGSVLLLDNEMWLYFAPVHDFTVYFNPDVLVRFLPGDCNYQSYREQRKGPIFLLGTPGGTCKLQEPKWIPVGNPRLELRREGFTDYLLVKAPDH